MRLLNTTTYELVTHAGQALECAILLHRFYPHEITHQNLNPDHLRAWERYQEMPLSDKFARSRDKIKKACGQAQRDGWE